jgi:class 3 adenylate cyclase
MRIEANEPCPLPDDPVLAEWAAAMRDEGAWAWIVDATWNLQFVTNAQRLSLAADIQMVPIVIGEHLFGPETIAMMTDWPGGPEQRIETWRRFFANVGGATLADTAGGKAELRSTVDPIFADGVDELSPSRADVSTGKMLAMGTGNRDGLVVTKTVRIRDTVGGLRGTVMTLMPAVGMNVLGTMALERDPGHLERTRSVASARRRPAAILFADLEGSSALSRTLSTSSYFAAGRRIVRATDRCVVDAGGLVGRHVGDGVVAFFPVEVFESESAAAKACIRAARDIKAAMPEVASQCGLPAEQLVMRFGLHWGSTIYMGNIGTLARSEVTALGDEVNEAARIEACATGGRLLVSKPLVERLQPNDAAALDIDIDRLGYTQLSEMTTATDKARRDAPAIAVCEI